jgi:hypothetical protein
MATIELVEPRMHQGGGCPMRRPIDEKAQGRKSIWKCHGMGDGLPLGLDVVKIGKPLKVVAQMRGAQGFLECLPTQRLRLGRPAEGVERGDPQAGQPQVVRPPAAAIFLHHAKASSGRPTERSRSATSAASICSRAPSTMASM